MDFSLNDEQQMFRRVIRDFCEAELKPYAAEVDEKAELHWESIRKMADLGLLGCTIEGYGCAGLNGVSYGLICQELERGDAGLRSFASVQSSLCMYPIYAYGSEEQNVDRYFEGITPNLERRFRQTESEYIKNLK